MIIDDSQIDFCDKNSNIAPRNSREFKPMKYCRFTTNYVRVKTDSKYGDKQNKYFRKNNFPCKNKVDMFNERNENFGKIINQLKKTISHLKYERLDISKKLGKVEASEKKLRHKFNVSHNSENQLKQQNFNLKKKNEQLGKLLNKFIFLECSEIESKIYIENKLDKKIEECKALQNQLH